MTTRIHVFDPGFNSKTGHHAHFALNMPRSFARYDVEYRYYGHRDAPLDLPHVKVVPHFRHSHYRKYTANGEGRLLKEFTEIARDFAADIASLGTEAPESDDVVFLPTSGLREIMGLCEWMKTSGRNPRVAMLFHRTFPGDFEKAELGMGTIGRKLYVRVGRVMREVIGEERCMVTTTNRFLADLIARPLGQAVHVMPAPVWYGEVPAEGSGPTDGANERAIVSVLGHTRPEKGLERIPAIIRMLHERRLPVHCIVQVNPSKTQRRPVDVSDYEMLERNGMAELVRDFLPDQEMNALIRRSTFVLMPYDRISYRQMLSGMFAQVTAMGRPGIVPSGTWMANQIALNRAAGVAFPNDSPDTIADAVETAMKNRESLSRRAEELAPAWRRERSGEALVAKLMEWAAVKARAD